MATRHLFRLRTLWGLLPLLLLVGLAAPSSSRAAEGTVRITDYRVIGNTVRDASGKPYLAVRSFLSEGQPHLLVFDPDSFKSYDLPASSLHAAAASDSSLAASPLVKALARYDSAPYPLQNGGVVRGERPGAGVFLTVDLCPSKRPFEREMFDALAATGKGRPVPVAVAVTGLWLVNHPEELAFLKRESAAGRLAVTWVNHSYHHTYQPGVPLSRNFVLTPGTDFSAEVLDLEQLLLSRGLVPSPFFRFPGLVSDAATVKRLRELSLVPIGADAWLAKGENPKPGSFILVHGNGNEPKGIKLLMPLLHGAGLPLLPLPEAFGR